ncbi:2'-5' RNA ligase [Salirhabdus euzebyi]|uniref:RNA 2',3'-cyclic phosphodiesterase n=1 Tax=Salirhabdus euzebyi TaxID=394506 RepID=A0A841Q1K7_9BACI|nr:RNA 2',3'-cyclic phosphodiesterase [Salirhabdus euzebyi]MBB6452163.1 2'-5' RNA ligase [Salirhabdus euzebyi]
MSRDPHYFVGIPVQEKMQHFLIEWQNLLQNHVSYKVWTNPNDFHITLKFLGAVNSQMKNQLIEHLNQNSFPSTFGLKIGDLGFFGHKVQPRVMWTGVEKSPELTRLQSEVEGICSQLMFPKENRPYHPHITLAKKWGNEQKRIEGNKLKGLVSNVKDPIMEVNCFHLYEIHPNQSIKYQPVHTIKLK